MALPVPAPVAPAGPGRPAEARRNARVGWLPGGLPERTTPVRAGAVAVVLAGLVWSHFWRLGVAVPPDDEWDYTFAGWQYVHGIFTRNQEHPPLAKYLFGIAQLVFGQGNPSSRLIAAGFGVLTGVFMMLLAREIAGFWAAIIAGALWWLLPLPYGLTAEVAQPRLDRFGMLDGVMAALAMAALYAGWRWVRSGGWRIAICTGVLVGLAAAAKVPGVATLPVIVGAGLLRLQRRTGQDEAGGSTPAASSPGASSPGARSPRARLGQGAALAGTAAATFLATYLPFGLHGAIAALRYMVHYQTQHADAGHLIYVQGHVYHHAPWWTVLAYQWVDNGPWVSIAMPLACVAAVVLRRNLAVVYVSVAGALCAMVLGLDGVVLPQYAYDWLPQELTVAAVGLVALAGAGRSGWRTPAGWAAVAARSLAVVLLAILVAAGVAWQGRLAVLRPANYALLPTVVRGPAPIVVAFASVQAIGYYMPDATLIYIKPDRTMPARTLHIFDYGAVAAVVMDPAETLRNPTVERILQRAAANHGMHETRVGYLRVWLPADRAGPATSEAYPK
ncbi:MAG: glycosyltransferase family 39 protein [Micromonosporaceae bacterium]|nr:glycosyltransferase family 39 protein [Micromonosporaceae bacterium]